MSTTEVSELITALGTGELSLDEVADRFRHRQWAASRMEPADDFERAENRDPGLPVPGSIDEVALAFDRGELTDYEYDVLAEAVAEAISARPAPRG